MHSIRPIWQLSRHHTSLSSFCARSIHSTAPNTANPVPHRVAPGPPPPVPEPVTPDPIERVARKRKQAELISEAKTIRLDAKNPGRVLKKRFWKDVLVKETPEGLQIYLDTRPVKTQSKQTIAIPFSKKHLATAMALEWDSLVSAQQAMKTHHIPLTSLVSRALDIQEEEKSGSTEIRQGITKMLLRYLSTDTLLCWAPSTSIHDPAHEGGREKLRDLQIRVAKPIIAWLVANVWPGVDVVPVLETESILPTPQPDMTVEVVRGWIAGLPAWELAGLERAVLATKSLLVATRLLVEWSEELGHLRSSNGSGERFGVEDAAHAANLEVHWQTGQWGEVEDTHDVDKEDVRRQLGGVVLLVSGDKS